MKDATWHACHGQVIKYDTMIGKPWEMENFNFLTMSFYTFSVVFYVGTGNTMPCPSELGFGEQSLGILLGI